MSPLPAISEHDVPRSVGNLRRSTGAAANPWNRKESSVFAIRKLCMSYLTPQASRPPPNPASGREVWNVVSKKEHRY